MGRHGIKGGSIGVWVALVATLLAVGGAREVLAQNRDIAFECPCSAEFTPDADVGGEGTLVLRFGVRSFRDARSAEVGVHALRRTWSTRSDGTRQAVTRWSSSFSQPEGSVGEIPPNGSVVGLVRSFRVREPDAGLGFAIRLWEAKGTGGDRTPNSADLIQHETLSLWPVPSDGSSGAASRWVDILTDSDGDGTGDVNERIAGTDPDSATSKPSGSEVDVLWLYQASLAGPDTVPAYHHAAVVANAMFVDSGTNLRLRSVGFAPVDDDDLSEGGSVKSERLDDLMDLHGADVYNFWYNAGDGIADPCGDFAAGCAGVGSFRNRGIWRPTSSSTAGPWPGVIAHELGHVMGLAHSARQGESYGAFRWSRGHYVGVWGPAPHFGTIMSYGSTSRTPVFSSPVSDRCRPLGACGLPTMHPQGADATRSLDLIRFQVADVRSSKPDSDGDGFVDAADAFPNDPGDWADLDGDGIGDNADPDADGDGRANADDAFPHDADEWADLDGDGLGDNADPDRDGDGVDNGDDLFPDDALDHADADSDGVGDNAQRLHPFRDANLRAVVERALGKAAGDPITDAEMAGLEALEVDSADISDLTGLALATGLKRLRLNMDEGGNRGLQDGGVADLSPLAGLIALETVWLATSPRLADLSPLAGLRSLASLRLVGTWASRSEVSDLSPLLSLPLTELHMRYASVGDVSPLSALPQLQRLNLSNNNVSDISPLAGLPQLRDIRLAGNRIADISLLAGLSNPWAIDLDHNLIEDISALGGLTNLEVLRLSDNRIDDISTLSGLLQLRLLTIRNNGIRDAMPLTQLTRLQSLSLGGNPLFISDFLAVFQPDSRFDWFGLSNLGISDLSPLAAFMGRMGARSWYLGLNSNPLTDLAPLVQRSLWEGGGRISLWGVPLDPMTADAQISTLQSWGVDFDNLAGSFAEGEPVSVPDRKLRGLLREATAGGPVLVDGPVTPERASGLLVLHAFGRGIDDLTGLEAATGLEQAHLASNRISDLTPLLGLKGLKRVDLDGNPLTEAALNEQVPELLAQVAKASCESGEGDACGTLTLNALSWTPAAGRDGAAWFRTGGYFAARLGVADAAQITFQASADRAALSPSVSADGLLRISPARLAGPATVTVTAQAPGADPVDLGFIIVSPKPVHLFLADGEPSGRHGFLRVVNHSERPGDVHITAKDDSGAVFGPVTLALEGRQAVHLNSRDLEGGNPAKSLREGLGDGEGDWRLTLEGHLNAEALAYVRTRDGFVTAMHEVAPQAGEGHQELLFFNPGSNNRQQSVLRLVNEGDDDEAVRITGIDDAGAEGAVTVDLPAGKAVRLTAAELEGGAAPGLSGALGDGTGKWRLRIAAGPGVIAMGLLETPTGHLANLSAPPPAHEEGGGVSIPLFLSASEPSRQGFMRVVNRSGQAGEVSITAFDDAGAAHGAVTLSLAPREGRHLNSMDLEGGNAAKGLAGSLGAGRGHWRLALRSEGGLDFEALAYVRTNDGFVTAMHEAAPAIGGAPRIAFLNPGSNNRQESLLRLVNPGTATAAVRVTAIDDAGRAGSEPVVVNLPAGGSIGVTSKALEAGSRGLSGALGDGHGKWRLCVAADQAVTAMSLLETPTGHLTNLSGTPDLADCAEVQ